MTDKFHEHEALDRCHLIASMIDDHLMHHPCVEQDATVKKLVLLASEAIGQAYQAIGGCDLPAETQEQRESARVLWLAACEEAQCVVQNGEKLLLLTEEMKERIGAALGA
jgi:hypothetical protein